MQFTACKGIRTCRPGATLMDGGTHGLSLAPHISGFKRLLVIDAIDVGEKPGTLIKLEGEAVEKMPGSLRCISLDLQT